MTTSTIKPNISTKNSTLVVNENIATYTSNNPYTAPNDGYVFVRTQGTVNIHISNGVNQTVMSPNGDQIDGAVFIQKGLFVYVNGSIDLAYFRVFSDIENV